ncbi:MAG: polyprenyl synthetase family protein [Lentisphaeria bacterium]
MCFEDHYQGLVAKILPVILLELEQQGRLLPPHLREVAGSYLSRPGKCLRPVLLLLSCEAAGGRVETALPAAAAVELFHTWTLLHDDVIDHDSLRRGQETGHIRGARLGRETWDLPETTAAGYGQSLAILAGDVLQGEVVHLLTTLAEVPSEVRLALLAELSGRLNPELLAGEQLDMELACRHPENIAESEILEMMRLKTGALLGYCAAAGSAIGETRSPADSELALALRRFAEACGIAFQLQDDILGITGTEKDLGKNIGSDLREGKRTLLLAKAWKQCSAEERRSLAGILGNEQATEEQLTLAGRIFAQSGALQQTAELAEQYLTCALEILQQALPKPASRQNLEGWAALMVKRIR